MTRWFTLLAALVFATSASAQQSSVPKEIIGFNNINVFLVGNAGKCNITDTKRIAGSVSDKLGAIGIKQNPKSVVRVSVRIAGDRFGVLSVLCNYSVNVSFEAALSSKQIVNVPGPARKAIDRLKVLPITLWQANAFGVTTLKENMNPDAPGGAKQAEDAVIKGANALLTKFGELRK